MGLNHPRGRPRNPLSGSPRLLRTVSGALLLRTARGSVVLAAVRAPDERETGLSHSEIWHGIKHNLIAVLPLTLKETRWLA